MSTAAMQAVTIVSFYLELLSSQQPRPRSPHPDPRVEKLLSEVEVLEAQLG